MAADLQRPPLLVVISGPSGVGKDSVLNELKKAFPDVYFAVTATTRPRRANEVDGVDYTFLDRDDFQRLIDGDGLIEWAEVYGNMYGVPRKGVREALAGGRDAFVKVDVQGAETIRRKYPEAVLVFLMASSMEELEQRLRQRKTEDAGDLERRVDAAREEMASLRIFDYAVVNARGRLKTTVSTIQAIVTAEKCRVNPRTVHI